MNKKIIVAGYIALGVLCGYGVGLRAEVLQLLTPQQAIEVVHHDGVRDLEYSPDSRFVASSGDDRAIHLWDAHSGTLVRSFKGHKKNVMQIAFSGDGKMLASVSYDGSCKLWDVDSGQMLASYQTKKGDAEWLTFAPNGSSVSFATQEGRIFIVPIK